jgi:DnaJ-class molecular chaperone
MSNEKVRCWDCGGEGRHSVTIDDQYDSLPCEACASTGLVARSYETTYHAPGNPAAMHAGYRILNSGNGGFVIDWHKVTGRLVDSFATIDEAKDCIDSMAGHDDPTLPF